MKPSESRTVYDGKLLDVTIELWGDNEREIEDAKTLAGLLLYLRRRTF